jgi:hypothetical protein
MPADKTFISSEERIAPGGKVVAASAVIPAVLFGALFLILSLATIGMTSGQTSDHSMGMEMDDHSNLKAPWDNAQIEEGKSPLLAGKFKEAIAALTPLVKQYPKDPRIPYTLATIYFRMEENYDQGIPYALDACRIDPQDVRYRWLLRSLTLLAQRPLDSIPQDCALVAPPLQPSPVHFQDVAEAAGVNLDAMGRGAAWGDFDNDGRDDLLVCSERGPFTLYRNLGNGKFTNVAKQLGLIDTVGLGCYGAGFVDYDNDGYQDILLSGNGWGGDNRLFLFHNEQGKGFKDVTKEAGLGGTMNAFGASWADYDNDGLLDVAVASGLVHAGGERLLLYHNLGKGKFEEVGTKAGLTRRARWMNVTWGDYDGDGRQDLFAVSFDSQCALFHNLGNGQFEDVTEKAGIKCPSANYTATFLDYDNDGKPDIFVSTYPGGEVNSMVAHYVSGAPVPPDKRQLLFHNNGDGTFTRVSEQAGIVGWHGAMAAGVGDVDDDGYPDIILGTGNPQLDWAEPKPLYHNDGKGHFVDIGISAGLLDYGMLHGTIFSDYDNSGSLSFYENRGGFYVASKLRARLYQNQGTGHHTFEVRLIGTKSNRDAIGSHLMVESGDKRVYQHVDGGSGFGCMNSRIIHFGLGDHQTVDSLTVDWPIGRRQVWQHVPIDSRIEVIEGKEGFRVLQRFEPAKRPKRT